MGAFGSISATPTKLGVSQTTYHIHRPFPPFSCLGLDEIFACKRPFSMPAGPGDVVVAAVFRNRCLQTIQELSFFTCQVVLCTGMAECAWPVCACARVRAYVRACVHVCVCMYACVHACVRARRCGEPAGMRWTGMQVYARWRAYKRAGARANSAVMRAGRALRANASGRASGKIRAHTLSCMRSGGRVSMKAHERAGGGGGRTGRKVVMRAKVAGMRSVRACAHVETQAGGWRKGGRAEGREGGRGGRARRAGVAGGWAGGRGGVESQRTCERVQRACERVGRHAIVCQMASMRAGGCAGECGGHASWRT